MNETITLYSVLRAHGLGVLVTKSTQVLDQYSTLLNARIDHHLSLIGTKNLDPALRAELQADMRWYNMILAEIDVMLAKDAEAARVY